MRGCNKRRGRFCRTIPPLTKRGTKRPSAVRTFLLRPSRFKVRRDENKRKNRTAVGYAKLAGRLVSRVSPRPDASSRYARRLGEPNKVGSGPPSHTITSLHRVFKKTNIASPPSSPKCQRSTRGTMLIVGQRVIN